MAVQEEYEGKSPPIVIGVMINIHDYDQYPKQVKITQHVHAYTCTVHEDTLHV